MTRELLNAFCNLRNCERDGILQNLNYHIHKHTGEATVDYCTRVVRQICNDGKVRELEQEMREYQ